MFRYRPFLGAVRANFSPKSVLQVHSRRLYLVANKPRVNVNSVLGVLGLGLGLSVFSTPTIHCEGTGSSPVPPVAPQGTGTETIPLAPSKPSTAPPEPPTATPEPPTAPPPSIVNVYELSFGTVAGICAGVFIKKGAKAIAFFVGGVFVLLQYLASLGYLKVDWGKVGGSFERRFYTADSTGKKPPTIYVVWKSLVDFLTADFQPRASFLAGLVLGIRIG